LAIQVQHYFFEVGNPSGNVMQAATKLIAIPRKLKLLKNRLLHRALISVRRIIHPCENERSPTKAK